MTKNFILCKTKGNIVSPLPNWPRTKPKRYMEKLNSEQQILVAARKIFVKRGFAGARMQEIANEAGINKGLLHYYFKSKNRLFNAVFDEAVAKIIPKYNDIFDSNLSLYRKIERFVSEYMDVLTEDPSIPSFVLNEINRDPKAFFERFEAEVSDSSKFYKEIEQRVAIGAIVPIDPKQLFVNILSMCMFPYIGAPFIQASSGISNEEFKVLMEERKKGVVQFIINAIKR